MPDQEKSLREQIEDAVNAEQKQVEKTQEEQAPEVVEDDQTEDVKEQEVVEAEQEEVEEAEESDEAEEKIPGKDEAKAIPPAPLALDTALKSKWAELPDEVRSEFIRLEKTQAKGMQKIAEDANFGKTLRQIVQPYEAMLRAEGATAEKAVASLLNTAYQLRTATPAQKQQLFFNMAAQYGVDVKGLASAKEPPQVDPNVQYLQQKLSQLEQQTQQRQHSEQQAQESALMGGIEVFASDPEHEHFGAVQDAIVRLVEPFGPGEAITPETVQQRLKKAYDQACWAVPEIRQQILQKERAQEEANRKKQAKVQVEAKKAAGSSLKGSPAKSTAGKLNPDMGLREMLEQAVYGDGQRI